MAVVTLKSSSPPAPEMARVGPFQTSHPLAKDLLQPSPEEKSKHRKKHLVQSPSSYFMDVKCPGCYSVTTIFSHAETVVLCVGCCAVLRRSTGGKAKLTEACSFRQSSTKTSDKPGQRNFLRLERSVCCAGKDAQDLYTCRNVSALLPAGGDFEHVT
ncbi:40S ribosomal protein S27-like [Bubalus kerabau]|uniref:40S ribosomal protein S27-like n=1 Tax=Bubalus carabanensis TaxID=3119969 RepID=UPI00244E710A|nr:40S ribosomal protein S27-like [Bubalus carabanensis]